MPQRQHEPASARLAWLGTALGAAPGTGTDISRDGYLLMPSAARPQMLLPAAQRAAAWAALRAHSDAASLRFRLARELSAWACRAGLGGAVFRARLPETGAGLLTGSLPWPGLLAEIFGRPDLAVAISVGQLRPQIKPILHVSTRAGQLLGHVKVGWNDVTRSLVRHEAAILGSLAESAPGGQPASGETVGAWRVPRVLYHGEWRDRVILATSDIGSSPWFRGRRTALPAAATRQAGRALGTGRETLGGSAFWSDFRDRAGRLVGHEAVDPGLSADLAAAMAAVETRHAAAELDFGLMHGDWAPWNMASAGSALAVWDWERARTRGPAGFDGVFFRFQVDLWIRGLPPQQALERSLRELPATMTASGASPEAGPAVLRLVLLEVALRQLEGVAAGTPVPPRVYRALGGLMRRLSGETWRSSGTQPAPAAAASSTAPRRTGEASTGETG